MNKFSSLALVGMIAASIPSNAEAIFWIDWTACENVNGVTCTGTLTTASKTIGVTYNNPRGIAFAQFGEGTAMFGGTDNRDFFLNRDQSRTASNSPYTSDTVTNIPPPKEIIALQYAGTQTLTFSEPVRDLFFAYVSLNGNGYAFDQDFEILSFGHPIEGNLCGFWGCGKSAKNVAGGEYQLVADNSDPRAGEPHGTIGFSASFDSLTWRSMSDEYWNGFTLGISTSEEEYQESVNPSVSGDPHFLTWSGAKYDFHGVCDLVLLQNPGFENGLGINIHVRTKQLKQFSYVSAAVLQIGDDTLEVMGDNHETLYWINKEANVALEKGINRFPISHKKVNSKQDEFIVDLGGDVAVVMKTFKKFVRVNIEGATEKTFGTSLGLLGSYGSGEMVARDKNTRLADVNAFGQEWQVLPSEGMLFHSVEGPQAPAKCVIPQVSNVRRRLAESKISQDEAEIACARVNADDFDMCVFDVMATGDQDVVGAY